MLFTNESKGAAFAKDPAVVRFQGSYFLYHSTDETLPDGSFRLGIGIASAPDLENWRLAGDLPCTQSCEARGIGAPAAIVLRGQVHLFYQTYGNWRTDAICHAVSDDGLHFRKDPTNPIYHPGDDWCSGRAIDADAVAFQDRLFLYYATRDQDMRIQQLGVAWADLGSDYSAASWQHGPSHSILAPELPWEQECIEAPATIVQDDKIYLFYGGAYNCKPQQIGCAVSSDGISFQRVSDLPLLGPGPQGAWNSCESGHPYAFRDDDGQAWLFYQGSPDMGKTWYLSRARITWENGVPRIGP